MVNIEKIESYYDRISRVNNASFIESVRPEVKKDPPLFSVNFVAGILGVSRSFIYQIIAENDIDYKVVGRNSKKLTPLGIDQLRDVLREKPKKYNVGPDFQKSYVIGINSNKGGTGKTQTSYNLAAYLNLYEGQKVLLIDFDAQSTLTGQVGLNSFIDPSYSSYRLMTPDDNGFPSVSDCVYKTNWNSIDIIPATLDLQGAEFEIPVKRMEDENFLFWDILNSRLSEIKDNYDFIIIDSPPSLSFVTINVVMASDGLIMPVLPSQASLHSLISYLRMLVENISAINEALGVLDIPPKTFDFFKVALNMFETNAISTKIARELQLAFEEDLFLNVIVRSKSIEQAVSEFKNIYEITPKTKETHLRCLDSFKGFGSELINVIKEVEGVKG